MELNSPVFLFVFLPAFLVMYSAGSQRLRLASGILGSLLFYAWGDIHHLPLIIGLTLGTYGAALGMDRWRERGADRALLWISVAIVVGLLIGYRQFRSASFPLGLSYLAFQIIAYLIAVGQHRENPERKLAYFSFYLLLFPKLPTGPIVRYSEVRPQIARLTTEPTQVADGLRRFLRGLAKKALVADTLARLVDPIFLLSEPAIPPAWAWLVLVSYSVQLYYDFSGYSDMAIGIGRMLGLKFPENFDAPYLARSISDFWRRWHMTLSFWFRDYVFYPLERRRLRYIGQPLNIVVVFLLVGVWHGQTANFVLWGLIHGVALAIESSARSVRQTPLPAPLRHVYTLAVVLFGWVFFRSPTPDFALGFLRRLAGETAGLVPLPFAATRPLPIVEPTIIAALIVGLILLLPIENWLKDALRPLLPRHFGFTLAARIAADVASLALLLAVVAFSASSTFRPGLYANF